MSDPAMQASWRREAERVEAALPQWAADPRLAALTASTGTALLVLDMEGRRILHASEAASTARRVIADSAGSIYPQLGLNQQIARLGALAGQPKLARLRFDTRGVAPPVTCLVARAPVDADGSALLIAPIGPLTGLRRAPALEARDGHGTASDRLQPSNPDHAIVTLSPRLIWRSDGRGVLTAVSGASVEVVEALVGRSWLALCSAGLVPGSEPAFNGLTERRTFRGLCLIVDLPGCEAEVEIEFSGAPSGRSSQPFSGFAGFGSVRQRRDRQSGVSPPEAPVPDGESAQPETPGPDLAPAPEPEALRDPAEPSSAPQSAAPQDSADLSSTEHDAFEEIARTLGARFTRVEEQETADIVALAGHRTSVTPFPLEAAAQAEHRKQEFDAAVAGALDCLPTGVLIHDGRVVLFVNRWLLARSGLADARAVEAAGWLEKLEAGSSAAPAEHGIALAAGSGRDLHLEVERASVEWQGRPASIVLARDASEAKAPTAQSGTVDAVKSGSVTLDAQGRVLTLDPQAAALVAAGRRKVVGEAFIDLFPPESAKRIEESLRQARERETSEPREVEGRAGDASIPLSLRVARLLSTGEAAYRATLVQIADARRDAREQRDAALRIEATARRKFDYVARAGQAIRAPVSNILTLAAAMLDETFVPLESDRHRAYLRDLHASGEEALALVNDLVDLAKIDAGRIDLAFTDVPLNEIVSGCIASIQPQAARERVVVRTSLSPDLKTLVADERSVRQATMAVIANAVRFSDPGGQVIVTTTIADRGEIALRVRDTGSGLSADEIEQALDPFSRDGRPDARHAFVGGLGLSLSKALVEANRGRFSMTSRRNEGTLVEFVFPASQARTA